MWTAPHREGQARQCSQSLLRLFTMLKSTAPGMFHLSGLNLSWNGHTRESTWMASAILRVTMIQAVRWFSSDKITATNPPRGLYALKFPGAVIHSPRFYWTFLPGYEEPSWPIFCYFCMLGDTSWSWPPPTASFTVDGLMLWTLSLPFTTDFESLKRQCSD